MASGSGAARHGPGRDGGGLRAGTDSAAHQGRTPFVSVGQPRPRVLGYRQHRNSMICRDTLNSLSIDDSSEGVMRLADAAPCGR